MRQFRFSLLIMLAVLIVNGWPQGLTGNLNGRILDSEGFPIPQIRITVVDPQIQLKREVFSDEAGFFVVSALPSGIYVLEVEHSAFQKVTMENVVIRIGKTTTIGEIRLEQISQEKHEVIVSATQPLIDPVNTTMGENLKPEMFEQLPG